MDLYELWDGKSGNQIGEYADEAEALLVVREAVKSHGIAMVDGVSLGRVNDDGDATLIAAGLDLAALAGARFATPART